MAIARCRVEAPPMMALGGGHQSACWRAHEVAA
jgi:hypothetical protein